MKLTLLGTGTPSADPMRRGPSQVIEHDGELVLVDTGAGTLHRLVEAGYFRGNMGVANSGARLKHILYTHLHSDHCTGLADILWSGWISNTWQEPPLIVGPPGTAQFVERLIAAYEYDISVRTRGEPGMVREKLQPRVREIEDGDTFDTDGLRVRAIRVEHDPVDQAFGYRIEDGSASLVISGDTSASQNLIKNAQDADLLVHEVFWSRGFERTLNNPDLPEARRQRVRFVQAYHTGSDDVGRVAAQSNARQVVMSHVISAGAQPDDLVADVAASYKGKITVGEDLMTFELAK